MSGSWRLARGGPSVDVVTAAPPTSAVKAATLATEATLPTLLPSQERMRSGRPAIEDHITIGALPA